MLTPEATIVLVGARFPSTRGKITPEDLLVLRGLLEAGKVKPVIDRPYELGKTLDALRYLGEGHARGKIVLT